jgi:hypothetical protein
MAKVRRYRRPQLRLLELARVWARDRRYPRTSQARWKAQNAGAGRAPIAAISADSVDFGAQNDQ